MSLKWGYLAAFVLCLGGIVGFIVGLTQHQTESALNAHGVRVPGVVRYGRSSSSGSTSQNQSQQQSFFLDVAYKVNGQPTERWFECTLMALDTHPQGSAVTVLYDPSDPANAMLGDNLNSESSGWTLYGSILAFIGGILLALYIKLNSRQLADEYGDSSAAPPDQAPPPDTGHWSNDPLSEENPGDIPTK